MTRVCDALTLIKQHGPLSAKRLADLLAVEERAARSLIDRLREKGEPVWHDTRLGAFWWRDDLKPNAVPRQRWKRDFG